MGCGFAFVLLGLVGKLVDTIPLKLTFPFFFCLRAGVFFLVYNITNPVEQKIMYFTTVPLLHGTYYAVVIVIASFL